jgi:hypothetical protein
MTKAEAPSESRSSSVGCDSCTAVLPSKAALLARLSFSTICLHSPDPALPFFAHGRDARGVTVAAVSRSAPEAASGYHNRENSEDHQQGDHRGDRPGRRLDHRLSVSQLVSVAVNLKPRGAQAGDPVAVYIALPGEKLVD